MQVKWQSHSPVMLKNIDVKCLQFDGQLNMIALWNPFQPLEHDIKHGKLWTILLQIGQTKDIIIRWERKNAYKTEYVTYLQRVHEWMKICGAVAVKCFVAWHQFNFHFLQIVGLQNGSNKWWQLNIGTIIIHSIVAMECEIFRNSNNNKKKMNKLSNKMSQEVKNLTHENKIETTKIQYVQKKGTRRTAICWATMLCALRRSEKIENETRAK